MYEVNADDAQALCEIKSLLSDKDFEECIKCMKNAISTISIYNNPALINNKDGITVLPPHILFTYEDKYGKCHIANFSKHLTNPQIDAVAKVYDFTRSKNQYWKKKVFKIAPLRYELITKEV